MLPAPPLPPPPLQVIDDKECSRRAEEYKARNEPHFYMMEMAPGARPPVMRPVPPWAPSPGPSALTMCMPIPASRLDLVSPMSCLASACSITPSPAPRRTPLPACPQA